MLRFITATGLSSLLPDLVNYYDNELILHMHSSAQLGRFITSYDHH